MSHDANTYHCSRISSDIPFMERLPICGCEEKDLGSYYPDAFMSGPVGKFWTRCPDCMAHPDLPLVLLGDLA